jgi:hypothetical protein
MFDSPKWLLKELYGGSKARKHKTCFHRSGGALTTEIFAKDNYKIYLEINWTWYLDASPSPIWKKAMHLIVLNRTD